MLAGEGLWSRRSLLVVGLLVGVVALVRLPFVMVPYGNDEGGFLFVAGRWGSSTTQLYGDQWVDRPPALMLAFKAVSVFGESLVAARIASLVVAAVAIAAAYVAGWLVGRRPGALAAALVLAGLSANYAINAYQLSGEGIATALMITSCAMVTGALTEGLRARSAGTLGVAAGATACLAVLVKQNFLDAAVYAVALLVLQRWSRWRLALTYGAGFVGPLALTAVWAAGPWGPGVPALWDALVAKRPQIAAVLATSGLEDRHRRLTELGYLVVASGIVVVVLCFLLVAVLRRDQWRSWTPIALMLAYGAASIWYAGSYWPKYLVGLGAGLALAAAFAAGRPPLRLPAPVLGGIVLVAAGASALVGRGMIEQDGPPRARAEAIADWLAISSLPGDSVVTGYGYPQVFWRSGLEAPYPYSWSLQVRAMDPDLELLTTLANSSQAPIWLVEIGDFDWWGLDNDGFRAAREVHYRRVAELCGLDVYLHVDAVRHLAPDPCKDAGR
jgi:hypothetical protein